MDWIIDRMKVFKWLFAYKVFSLGIQGFLGSLVITNGSSNEPFLTLKTVAYFGAVTMTFRSIDALIDPAFRNTTPKEFQQPPSGNTTIIKKGDI